MGNMLVDAINKGGHVVNHIDCSQTDEGKDFQQALADRLRKFSHNQA